MTNGMQRRWRDASLTIKGGIVVLMMFLAMIVAGAFGVRDARANAEARKWAIHSINVRRQINNAIEAVAISSSEHFAFLLTRRPANHEAAIKRSADAQAALKLLEELVADHPEQMMRLGRAAQSLDPFVVSVNAGEGDPDATHQHSEQVLQLLKELLNAEQVILEDRLALQGRMRTRSFFYFGAAIIVGMFGGALVGLVYTRNIVRRLALIGDYAVEQAGGNEAIGLEDQGNDEIGVLARRLREATELAHTRGAELKATQGRLQAILDHMTSIVYVKDLQGRYLFVNKAFNQINEPLYGDVIGKTNWDFMPPEEVPPIEAIEARVLETCKPIEIEETFTLPDGEYTFVTVRFCLPDEDGRPYAHCGIAKDITDRKRAMVALQHAKDELEHRVAERTEELAGANAALRSENEERTRINQRMEQQLLRMHLLNQITRGIAGRHDLGSLFHVVLLNLKEHLRIDIGVVFFFEEKSNILLVGAHLELEADTTMRLTLQNGQVLSVGENGMRKCVNGATIHEPQISEADPGVIGMLAKAGIGAIVAVPLRASDETLGVLLIGRKQPDSFSSSDCEFLTQLGAHVALALAQLRLLDQLKRAYDDLKQTQHHMAQQERLRAMGQMASGIAHDINNTLGPITLYCDILLEDYNLDENARKHVQTILTAGDNIAKTVAGLRHFYRPPEEVPLVDLVHLNSLVNTVVELTKPRWRDMTHGSGKTIDIRLELSPENPSLEATESELHNVVTNLIFNAVDAMPDGGIIRIRTAIDGENAILEVQDSGVGMDESVRSRCLDPFFTTKGEGGTGLGLSMVYGIVKRHNGSIDIDTAAGEGSTFRLTFPLRNEAAHATPDIPVTRPARSLRILCVDDDVAIRTSLNAALGGDGHLITLADSGDAALTLCGDAFECPYDVVITDLGMPRMDGRELASRMRSKWKNLPIILLTGWGTQMREYSEHWTVFSDVLAKPPRLQELRTALAKAMREKEKSLP